jgi:hypothetical protein
MAGARGKGVVRLASALGGIVSVAQRVRPPADLTDQVALVTGSSRIPGRQERDRDNHRVGADAHRIDPECPGEGRQAT